METEKFHNSFLQLESQGNQMCGLVQEAGSTASRSRPKAREPPESLWYKS
jgi:hypothetical protein